MSSAFDLAIEEIKFRGGVVDRILESVVDASILVARDGTVLFASESFENLAAQKKEDVIGHPMRDMNMSGINIFKEVMEMGERKMGERIVIGDKKLLINIIPVLSGRLVIGAVGLILFRNLNALKKALSAIDGSPSSTIKDMYDKFVRTQNSYTFSDYIGESIQVQNMLSQCRRIARSQHPVLLMGETGTGKEVIANAIYAEYRGQDDIPFVKINCSAIPNDLLESELFGHEKGSFTGASSTKKGKFEIAAGGIILLDEIGEMDLRLQTKLLRVLEEREFERIGGNNLLSLSARVIASTNQNLRTLCARGRFRLDLYYRLNTFEIIIPPLRSHKEDIPVLIRYFMSKDFLSYRIDDDAVAFLMKYDWPGNIRELRNLLFRIQFLYPNSNVGVNEVGQIFKDLFSKAINTDPNILFSPVLPEEDPYVPDGNFSLKEQERKMIVNALKNCDYNLARSARILEISRSSLYDKMRKYHINISKQSENR